MLTQALVDDWLALFVGRLRDRFGARLLFVGHHGSWARGEGRPESDIDALVILDQVGDEDLAAYAESIHTMPHAKLVSTFMGSAEEIRLWPRMELIEVFYACRPIHGSIAGLVDPPKEADFVDHIRYTAAQVMHDTRHYLLHPHDPFVYVHRLHYRFKWACYALQSWLFLQEGRHIDRLSDLLPLLPEADDREVVTTALSWRDLEADRSARPLHYMRLLERWSRGMLRRLANL